LGSGCTSPAVGVFTKNHCWFCETMKQRLWEGTIMSEPEDEVTAAILERLDQLEERVALLEGKKKKPAGKSDGAQEIPIRDAPQS
jgi:hypothetical protein